MKNRNAKPLPRLPNRADADGWLYGIMVSEATRRAKIKRFHMVAWLACLSLVVSLSGGIMVSEHASAQSLGKPAKVSSDLLTKAHGSKNSDVVPVIIQLNASMSGGLNALLNKNGVHGAKKILKNLNVQVIDMPASLVDTVAASDEMSYISLDRETRTLGHVTATTGANLVRTQTTTTQTTTPPLGNTTTTTLDGTGIGLAVLDSGMETTHVDFLGRDGRGRIVVGLDFTGENRIDDTYGHGSHVSSIAAGNGRVSYGAYSGIAPNANLINLRVLNSQGTGTVSGTLAALDWVMTNRATYNIRVLNMSLGSPAVDSYKNDPVCRAVHNLVNA